MFVYELVQVEINPQSIGVFGRRVVGFSCIYMYIYLGGLKEEKNKIGKRKRARMKGWKRNFNAKNLSSSCQKREYIHIW